MRAGGTQREIFDIDRSLWEQARTRLPKWGLFVLLASVALTVGLFLLVGIAHAHTVPRFPPFVVPSQVTPRYFVLTPTPCAFEISAAAGLTARAPAERFNLLVGRVEMDSGFSDLAADKAALVARLTGKRVTAEIFAAAADLERA